MNEVIAKLPRADEKLTEGGLSSRHLSPIFAGKKTRTPLKFDFCNRPE